MCLLPALKIKQHWHSDLIADVRRAKFPNKKTVSVFVLGLFSKILEYL